MKKFEPILKHFDEILDYDNNVIFAKKNHKKTLCKEFGKANVNKNHNDEINDFVGGISRKHFYLCKSESLKELFDELIKPNCSYKTCYNDIIINEYKGDGVFPIEYVPVLVKEVEPIEFYLEEFCSKLSNFLQIPTAFYKFFKKDNDYYSLSVDFIKYGYTLESLKRKYIINFTEEMISACKRLPHAKEIVSNFIDQLLFRTLIIKDSDFGCHNIGILKSKKSVELAPNFDMALSLSYCRYNEEYLVLYLAKFYNQQLSKFCSKIKNVVDNNLLTPDVFENVNIFEDNSLEIKQEFIDSILENMKEFLELYEKINTKLKINNREYLK